MKRRRYSGHFTYIDENGKKWEYIFHPKDLTPELAHQILAEHRLKVGGVKGLQ